MKRKIAIYLLVSTVFATGTAGGNQAFGQSGKEPDRQPNSGPVGPNNGPYQNPAPFNPVPPIFPAGNFYQQIQTAPNSYNAPLPPPGTVLLSAGPLSSGPHPTVPQFLGSSQVAYPGSYPYGPVVPIQGMVGYGLSSFTVVKKDGSIERIEKEPGTKLSKEEFNLINETRQKVQSAVSQLRSPDADESKRKDAKELIAKYLKVEFQADQESRREQLKRLESQVEQLKKQLSKRDESQDKLIELRLQLLENDASGLSFPESWGNLPGLPPMNSNVHFHPTNLGMQPAILGQTYSNPAAFSPSPDVGRPTVPAPALPVPLRN